MYKYVAGLGLFKNDNLKVICKPSSKSYQYFADTLNKITDFLSNIYDNRIVLGAVRDLSQALLTFMKYYNWFIST